MNIYQSQRFKFLDALRGIAALMVVVFHYYSLIKIETSFELPYYLDLFFSSGKIGVQIFFVLSGFVIAYSVREADISLSFLGRFFIKRSIRLDPPYWIIIVFLVALAVIGDRLFHKQGADIPSLGEVIVNLLYLQDLLQMKPILPVAWTLCMEFQLYFFLVMALGILFKGSRIIGSRINDFINPPSIYNSKLFLTFFFFMTLLSFNQHLNEIKILQVSGFFIPYWYTFFMGCITCWVVIKLIEERWFWSYCGLMILLISLAPSIQNIATLSIGLLIYFMYKLGKLTDGLSGVFFQYFGKLSYSLYLIHWPIGMKIINFSLKLLGPQLTSINMISLFVLNLGITIIIAHLFWRWVESPCLKWSQQIIPIPRLRSLNRDVLTPIK